MLCCHFGVECTVLMCSHTMHCLHVRRLCCGGSPRGHAHRCCSCIAASSEHSDLAWLCHDQACVLSFGIGASWRPCSRAPPHACAQGVPLPCTRPTRAAPFMPVVEIQIMLVSACSPLAPVFLLCARVRVRFCVADACIITPEIHSATREATAEINSLALSLLLSTSRSLSLSLLDFFFLSRGL